MSALGCTQANEHAKECRVAVTSVAAYKERRAEEVRNKLNVDADDLPTSRRALAAAA